VATALYPTPARLALLRHIDDEGVRAMLGLHDDTVASSWDGIRLVTSRCDEMYAAGWIELGDLIPNASPFRYRRWRLTDAGRDVLAQHAKG